MRAALPAALQSSNKAKHVAPEPVRDIARRVVDARLAPAPPPPPGPIRRVSRARLMLDGTFGGSGSPAHVISGGQVEALVDLGK